MRNVRSYLPETEINQVQAQSYTRLNPTTGSTYGYGYKRRYGAQAAQPRTERCTVVVAAIPTNGENAQNDGARQKQVA
jgi:hypothetical protein